MTQMPKKTPFKDTIKKKKRKPQTLYPKKRKKFTVSVAY